MTHPSEVIKAIADSDLKGGKVLFVNMPVREGAKPNCLPTGICILASVLESHGVVPTIIDLNSYRQADATKPHGRFLSGDEIYSILSHTLDLFGDYDVVAISGMITTLKYQKIVAKIARVLLPKALIVSGGGLATQMGEALFRWIPQLDGIAKHDGDDTIVKIAYDGRYIAKHGIESSMSAGILNPYQVGERNGRPLMAYIGARPLDMDATHAPKYELMTYDSANNPILEKYINTPIWSKEAGNSSAFHFTMKRSINTISSRGCPYSCKFCYKTSGVGFGCKSAGKVLEEMVKYREQFNCDFIGFLDDTFLCNSQRILDIKNLAGQYCRDNSLAWGTHGRMDDAVRLVQGESILHHMGESGCKYIGFGAESADFGTLKSMEKGGRILSMGEYNTNGYRFPLSMVEAIRMSKSAGIYANLTWILGYPGETLEQLKNSVAFIEWQKDYYAHHNGFDNEVNTKMFVAQAYPGTEMFNDSRVQSVLGVNFGITFSEDGHPVLDKNLMDYIMELDDATKLIHDKDGKLINFSDMPDTVYQEAVGYVEKGETEKILGMGVGVC